MELWCSDTDDGHGPPIETQHPADYRLVAVEAAPPVVVVEDGRSLVAVGEHTSSKRERPERVEEVRRDVPTADRLGDFRSPTAPCP